ncbi:alpha/beta fold hydrolase [Massilia sp. CCM 8733]|uniref:Alpha/beta fold hydrolase n=1 Tax=Massilia mucilaginosa TaxID=2609282 RepID=A0ABX0NXE7_9BURK|nr:alpha/beta hydrolase [Massilia mucilaginosa]NHZ91426.1 alpha/beta fold hydrolase [Massilia mucilaginosa]
MIARFVFALTLAAGAPAFAADAPPAPPANRFAATLVPAERFEIGAVQVERHGKGRRALILIPGLASGSWVWQGTARQFMGDYSVYIVTLPGFDGRAPVPGKQMEAAQSALAQLIDTRKLVKPVLVGHSLGGVLALSLASQRPQAIGGVISIDGLPVFPGAEDLTPRQREQMAQQLARRMAPADQRAFAAQQQDYMRGTGVVDMARADELARLSARSDPGAVLQYMAETFAMDLRPALPQISAPVLLIAPYFEADASAHELTAETKKAYYASLIEAAPKAQVVTVAPARHFAMIDQPEQVNEAIRGFLNGL